MGNIIKRAVLGLLGVVVMLAYWSFTGSGNTSEIKGIPAKVGQGGGGLMSIEVESTSPARFSIDFGDDHSTQQFWMPAPAGAHTWTMDIPKEAGGYIELNAENPKAGDKLSWKIRLNGKIVDQQSETLEKPLTDGYAFFLQAYYDDYSEMETRD